jgi:23S rRNA pseudouridine2605 synthase
MTDEQESAFREGVLVHGRRTSPAEIKLIKPGANPWYEVRITEGRQNQIRLMFAYFGKLVEKLRRVKIAFLELDVPPGQYRALTPQEVEHLQKILTAKPVPRPVAKAKPQPAAKPAPKPKAFSPKPKAFPPKTVSRFPPKKKSTFPPKRNPSPSSRYAKKKGPPRKPSHKK